MLFSKGLADLFGFYLQKKDNQLISCWVYSLVDLFLTLCFHLRSFLLDFFMAAGRGGSDATDMIMDPRAGRGRNGG